MALMILFKMDCISAKFSLHHAATQASGCRNTITRTKLAWRTSLQRSEVQVLDNREADSATPLHTVRLQPPSRAVVFSSRETLQPISVYLVSQWLSAETKFLFHLVSTFPRLRNFLPPEVVWFLNTSHWDIVTAQRDVIARWECCYPGTWLGENEAGSSALSSALLTGAARVEQSLVCLLVWGSGPHRSVWKV